MIVACPSCGTRYRHGSERAGEAAAARCSHCDEMVPLVVAGRPYLIMPATASRGARIPAGMDDPRLAERLEGSASDAGLDGGPEAIPYGIATGAFPAARSSESRTRRFSGRNGSAPAIFDRRSSKLLSSRGKRLVEPARKEQELQAAVEIGTRGKALSAAVATVLALVGGATAYFSAAEQGLNPVTWTVAGGGLGLFMAWICLKWTRQQ